MKGQGARGSVKPGFEGGQTPLARRTPKLKGFNNPFRVEYHVVNLDTLEAFDAGGTEIDPEELRARGLVAKQGLVKVLGRGELTKAAHRAGPRLLGERQAGHRGGRRLGRDRAAAVGRPAPAGQGQRPHQPLEDPAGRPVNIGSLRRAPHRTRRSHPRALPAEEHVPGSGPAQQDPLHDLHRAGLPDRDPHPGPVRRLRSRSRSCRTSSTNAGVVGFLDLFSGGAITSVSVFFLGIMPYITASIIMQLLGVVIPKLEQWQQEGQSGQKKITQWTRYLTVGLALIQSTGFVFALKEGKQGLLGLRRASRART